MSHPPSSASIVKSKSVDGAPDMRRTASQLEVVSPVQTPPDTNRELLDIISDKDFCFNFLSVKSCQNFVSEGFERASSHRLDLAGYGHRVL